MRQSRFPMPDHPPLADGPQSPTSPSSQATNPVSFLDLPAEIRNQIYEYALVAPWNEDLPGGCFPRPLNFIAHNSQYHGPKHRHWLVIRFAGREELSRDATIDHSESGPLISRCLARTSLKHGYHIRRMLRSIWLHRSACGHRLATQMLRANRQIHHEATPILYGHNGFFMNFVELPHFLVQIGSSVKYLRYLWTWNGKDFTPSAPKDAAFLSGLYPLAYATDLELFRLQWLRPFPSADSFDAEKQAQAVFYGCRHWIEAVGAAHDDKLAAYDRVDMTAWDGESNPDYKEDLKAQEIFYRRLRLLMLHRSTECVEPDDATAESSGVVWPRAKMKVLQGSMEKTAVYPGRWRKVGRFANSANPCQVDLDTHGWHVVK
ncbi:hypothetical protein GTA08_BOTSDO08696 [Neofusicoccum parvum]|uniref:Uncharacterized protein n=2 Tax=Neofusicoccum parvum TaxID=310453 RepID=R1G5V4_BOTPV|nr:hypothetical protein UCRNP2_9850 [Neofusicoccum parvum UCRNP2]GME39157.1 hypothetical protein GTA08_BOTSDO08696 [Neofusicoccum parvum]GME52636.1 hypothetical protein GTA08_BOTSDO08696 [Neofusicoccum parvum]